MEKKITEKRKVGRPKKTVVVLDDLRRELLNKIAELDERYSMKVLSHDGYSYQLEQYVKNLKIINYKNQ